MKPAEDYILKQPEPYLSILLHLQLLIEQEFEGVVLKYKWKIPVYYVNGKQLCYLNVVAKKGYVDVGLWVCDKLKAYDDFLVSDGRKVVRSLRYFSLEEIDAEVLLMILHEVTRIKEKGFYKRS